LKMKAKRLLGMILAGGLGLLMVSASSDVLAQGKKKKAAEAAPPAVAAYPPSTKKPIELKPAELKWGMNHKQVAEVIDKVLDEDYKPLYQKVSPGVKMKALDAQLAEDKNTFRRSRIDFGKLPTGVDATPLKGEYTYLNKESMLTLTRGGHPKRSFFFIQDKLWKVIDEYTLTEGSTLGKTYPEAVVKLATKIYGVPGRVLEADYNIGRNATEVDWRDSNIHVRVIQRGDTALAIAYEDNATLGNLASLRPNKPVQDSGIDPAVAAAVRGGSDAAPPAAAPPAKDKPKQ
jgi:hypothetical protein